MESGIAAGQVTVTADEATDHSAEFDVSEAYLRLRDPIFRYVRRFASDDDEAADLTARTFERAVEKLGFTVVDGILLRDGVGERPGLTNLGQPF